MPICHWETEPSVYGITLQHAPCTGSPKRRCTREYFGVSFMKKEGPHNGNACFCFAHLTSFSFSFFSDNKPSMRILFLKPRKKQGSDTSPQTENSDAGGPPACLGVLGSLGRGLGGSWEESGKGGGSPAQSSLPSAENMCFLSSQR